MFTFKIKLIAYKKFLIILNKYNLKIKRVHINN